MHRTLTVHRICALLILHANHTTRQDRQAEFPAQWPRAPDVCDLPAMSAICDSKSQRFGTFGFKSGPSRRSRAVWGVFACGFGAGAENDARSSSRPWKRSPVSRLLTETADSDFLVAGFGSGVDNYAPSPRCHPERSSAARVRSTGDHGSAAICCDLAAITLRC